MSTINYNILKLKLKKTYAINSVKSRQLLVVKFKRMPRPTEYGNFMNISIESAHFLLLNYTNITGIIQIDCKISPLSYTPHFRVFLSSPTLSLFRFIPDKVNRGILLNAFLVACHLPYTFQMFLNVSR